MNTPGGSKTHDFDDEQLAALTEEEREEFLAENDGDDAGNEEGEGNEDASDEDAARDPADDGSDGDGDGNDDDDGASGDGADGADGGGDDGNGDAGDDAAAVDDGADEPSDSAPPDKPAPPVVDFQAPENAKERLEEIANERNALRKQFEDGDLTEAEYFAKVDPLDDERNDLRVEIKLAEKSQKMRELQEATAGETWANTTVPKFFENAEHAIYKENGILYDALDREVRRLQVAAMEAGQSQHNPDFLAQAHRQVMAAFGRPVADPAADPKGEQGEQDQRRRRRNGQDIPPTLGGLPAAGVEDTSLAGKYDKLDRLTGEELEAAMAKLSEAEQEEYLSTR